MPPNLALIVALPLATAVIFPSAVTVATEDLELVQTALLATEAVFPVLYSAVNTNVLTPPGANASFFSFTVSFVSFGTTFTLAVTLCP
ncbi:hypothetical protein D3C73_1046570 [compost metagenome]